MMLMILDAACFLASINDGSLSADIAHPGAPCDILASRAALFGSASKRSISAFSITWMGTDLSRMRWQRDAIVSGSWFCDDAVRIM